MDKLLKTGNAVASRHKMDDDVFLYHFCRFNNCDLSIYPAATLTTHFEQLISSAEKIPETGIHYFDKSDINVKTGRKIPQRKVGFFPVLHTVSMDNQDFHLKITILC